MQTIEYSTADKSQWGHGPWLQEPDKVQWKDEETGLPCLIVRNRGGAWCGYVGVSEGHKFYGIGYSSCVHGAACPTPKDGEYHYCEHRPESFLEAHGGITFADFCSSHTAEDFKEFQERMEASRAEAAKFPIGDAARRLREWSHVMTDFAAWKEKCQSVGICHLPGAGEPERVWWFGFDCAHSGDVSPGYDFKFGYDRDDSYKDIQYVKLEVTALAKQLKDRG